MSTKTIIWICVLIFSLIGGYIPIFLGSSFLSFWSILGNAVGGLVGIWVGFKVGNAMGS